MTPQLDPCPFCGCAVVSMQSYMNAEKCVAATCMACGAHGPVRYVASFMSRGAASLLAADDWNRSTNASPGSTAATTIAPTSPAPAESGSPSVPSNGGDGTGSPKRDRTKAAAKKTSRSWNSPSKRHPIADRIEAYRKRTGKSVWSGSFSVTDQSIDNYLKGKSRPSADTADKLARELDRLEAEDVAGLADENPAGEVGPKITTLPNSLPPIAKPGSLPDLKSRPARCAEVR